MDSRIPFRILLVEDNAGDVFLLKEALNELHRPFQLHNARDGQEALDYLHSEDHPKPQLVLLNLNLPRRTGHEVLEVIKEDAVLRRIPVIVLSTSASASEVGRAYDLHANCFVQKPQDLEEFFEIVRLIEAFWMRLAKLPPELAADTSSPQNFSELTRPASGTGSNNLVKTNSLP